MECKRYVMRKIWGWRTLERAGLDGVNLPICQGKATQLSLRGSIFTHQFLLQSFQQPYSRNSVYLLENKGLSYDIFRYYASYQGYHGDEESQSNQNKEQILHVNNRVSHKLWSRRPNLENRWLFMDSVVEFGILCGFLGELLNCINTALCSEPCGQKSIVGYRNVRYSNRSETVCFTKQRNLSLRLM